jgi:RimJ/RimL family protein N-acetyltransferase
MKALAVKPRIRVVAAHRLDTERLALRAPTPRDAPEVARLIAPPAVADWLVRVPIPYRLEHAAAWIERSTEERASGSGWPFLITRRGDGLILGSMDLSLEADPKEGTLGYWIRQDCWGCGYASEAAAAALEFAFAVMKLDVVGAKTLPHNGRSMRVLEKIGLTRRSRQLEDTVERGEVEVEYYSIKRADWRRRR